MLFVRHIPDIINAHESLWGTVKSRVHHIHKVYSAGPDGGDLMVFGVVEWTFNDEKVVDGTFVSRFIIEAGGSNGPRVKLFQAWAVSAKSKGEECVIGMDNLLIYFHCRIRRMCKGP